MAPPTSKLVQALTSMAKAPRRVGIFLTTMVRVCGPVGAIRPVADVLLLRRRIRFTPRGLGRTLTIERTLDQFLTAKGIFADGEYDAEWGFEPAWILDGGGHVGLATAWFHLRYPGARIVVVEPSADNLALLRANVAGLPGVEVIHGAVWDQEESVQIANPSQRSWAFRMTAGNDGSVPGYRLRDLIDRHQLSGEGLIKLDIEGAERRVLAAGADWIEVPAALVLELHDRFEPGCTDALDRAISARPHERWTKSENTFVRFTA